MIHSFRGTGGDGLRPASGRSALRRWLAQHLETWSTELHTAQAWDSFDDLAILGDDARIFSTAMCVNHGTREDIVIGERFVCRGLVRREAFGGRVTIGDDVYFGDNSIISSANDVTIGDRVLIAFDVRIFDNDSHPLDARARNAHIRKMLEEGHHGGIEIGSAPVKIGDDVWIGMAALIMKGVTIGAGAVIAGGSVVTSDVPPNTIAGGNPARVLRQIG